MRVNRTISIIFTIASCILAAACAVSYVRADHDGPEFSAAAADTIYYRGIGDEELLEGIAAYDRRDGDVTDGIVVEKVIENEDDRTAVAVYAARDKSGNVTKFSKQFPAVYQTEGDGGTAEAQSGPAPSAGSREIKDLEKEGEGGAPEEDGAEALPEEDGDGPRDPAENEAGEETPEEEDVQAAAEEEDGPPEEEAQAAAEEGQQAEEEDAPPEEGAVPDNAAPVLVLKTDEIKTTAGVKPPWVDIIRTMSDDKDSYETLFYNLQVSGFDRNTPGSYPVTVYTVDSDGNRSASYAVTVTVQ